MDLVAVDQHHQQHDQQQQQQQQQDNQQQDANKATHNKESSYSSSSNSDNVDRVKVSQRDTKKSCCLLQARPTLWCLLNGLMHYFDFLLDILLCVEYFHLEQTQISKFQMTLLFTLLPNVLISVASIAYSTLSSSSKQPAADKQPAEHQTECILLAELKLKHACFFLFTCFFNAQLLIGLSIWLFFSFKLTKSSKLSPKVYSANKRDLIELEYTILLIHLFHVLFNNVPQFLVQSIFSLNTTVTTTHTESNSFLNNQNNSKHLKLIQMFKLAVCLSRFGLSSIQLVKHFLLNEFNFKTQISNMFIANKFVSNIFTVMIRLCPLVYLYTVHPITVYFLISTRLVANCLYSYYSMFLDHARPHTPDTDRIRFSTVSVFWFMTLSLLRFNCFIDNFKFKSPLFVYHLIESLVIFILIFNNLHTSGVHTRSVLMLTMLAVVYVVNILNEYLLWTYCYGEKSPQFKDLFNKWILKQQMAIQVHDSDDGLDLDRQKFLA